MPIKAKLTKDEHAKLSEPLQALYSLKDGAYTLAVDGMVDQAEYDALETKLTEFRDNNRTIHGQLKKFEGIDPDAHRILVEENAKLKRAGIQKPDDIEAIVTAAVAKATQDTLDRIKKIETERDQANQRLSEKSLEDALWAEGSRSIRDTARRDFIARAKEVFTLDGDKIVAKDGDKPIYSKRRGRTTDPLTIEEFVNDPEWLPKDGGHLYKESRGTGAQKSDTTQDGTRILANDPAVLGANLEAMAKGGIVVQQ